MKTRAGFGKNSKLTRLKPETLLKRFKTFCVLDRKRISKSRHRRRAITCSVKCQKKLTYLRKVERDQRVCHHCGKPSTPERQRIYRAFVASLASTRRTRKRVSGKGVPGSATGIQGIAAIADIAPEGRKRHRPKKVRRVA